MGRTAFRRASWLSAGWAGTVMLCLSLGISGCGSGGGGSGEAPQQTARAGEPSPGIPETPPRPDPGPGSPRTLILTVSEQPLPTPEPDVLPPTVPSDPLVAPEEIPTEAPRLKVDLAARRVFLPEEGWIPESEFWDIYFNDPRRLPGNIDFSTLYELGYPDEPPRTP